MKKVLGLTNLKTPTQIVITTSICIIFLYSKKTTLITPKFERK